MLPCVGVVAFLQQQLGKSEVCQGKFRAEVDFASRLQCLQIVRVRSRAVSANAAASPRWRATHVWKLVSPVRWGHGRESRGQGLGRGPVFDHNRGLEQHDELIDPGLVVKTTFEVVQHWV
jgi:hypothetical protein